MENQSFAYSTNSSQPTQTSGSVVAPKITPTENLGIPKKKTPIGLIIGLIVSIIVAIGLGVLTIFYFNRYTEASTNLSGQIEAAVAEAVNEKAIALENDFIEREKEPFKTFAGPADYGELSFKYPKTWSVYIAKDASNGGDFEAYLNPSEVNPVSETTVNSLRVKIVNQSFENATTSYSNLVKSGKLELQVITVNGQTANRYSGTFESGLKGAAVVIKIRDKAAILRTDSELFLNDFNTLIETVKFNA